jgi:hypothetical protein
MAYRNPYSGASLLHGEVVYPVRPPSLPPLSAPCAGDGGGLAHPCPLSPVRDPRDSPRGAREGAEGGRRCVWGGGSGRAVSRGSRGGQGTRRPIPGLVNENRLRVTLGLGRIAAFYETAHPLYTRFTNVIGASASEAIMRPDPR